MITKVKVDSKCLKFKVRIVVEKDDPGYHAYAPSLRGLHMPGDPHIRFEHYAIIYWNKEYTKS